MSIFRGSLFNFGFQVIPKELKEAAKSLNDAADYLYNSDVLGVVRVAALCVGSFIVVLTVYHTERTTRAKGKHFSIKFSRTVYLFKYCTIWNACVI